ncbi:MAG TPA: HEAT repeat domain-containing protein [Parachlamydiaceae bacterium]|nr:HEAT repeat domain-containing protein [Parachlamydiaceae bacterium]
MTSIFFTAFLSVFSLFSAHSFAAEIPLQPFDEKLSSTVVSRISAHLIINDYQNACHEAMWGIYNYPQSKAVWIACIRALAKSGDEKGMMTQWKIFIEKFPEEAKNREVLENLAWAVIDKAACSSSPAIRVTAMLGAFFSQDAKGVVLLQQGLRDHNSFLRAAAVKLSSHLMDASLQDELFHLLQTEKDWGVRLEVIRAIGELRVVEATKELQKVIGNEQSHAEEKAAAIEALVSLSDGIDHQQLSRLVAGNRAGMRMFACEMIAFFDQPQDIDKLFPLLEDHHSDVRAKVLQTIGRLRVQKVNGQSVDEIAERATHDPDTTVAVTAAWVLTINNPEKGLPVFQKFLNHPIRETRYFAAAALAATGRYGLGLMRHAFYGTNDIYVKMNLAIGMIGQRVDTQAACDCLFRGLSEKKERWAWDEEDSFRVLAPSKTKHDEAIPNYPEAVNQLTRLEVLQILAMVQYPHAQQAVKNFLKESNWGISGIASALLLTEGDDEAVDLVHTLLKDNDPKVKVQAALILALWGKGDDVVQLLQEAYPSADRELKGQILEGVGRVGSENSLLFLAERLQEPYQTLRIIAAASLLECLYH